MLQRRYKVSACLLVLILLSFGAGCAKKATPHPNQINSFDGATYDTLITAQATLSEAKAQFAAGKLPAGSKDIINTAGAAYETARTSWVTWRDVYQGLKPGDANAAQAQLASDMTQLAGAIANLTKLIQGGLK